jgi:electron transport complex protein RnfD
MSFPAAATTWLKPEGIKTPFYQLSGAVDGVTMSTPLGFIKEGISTGKISDWKAGVAALASNMHLSSTADVYKELFLGNRGGSIGETSILFILIGGLFLFFTKTIDWKTPVSMLVSAAILSCLLGFDPIVALLSGGLVFGAVFMATDYSSTPLTSTGKVIFGIGAGIITVLVRKFGNYPEGVMYSILIMNMATPFLNKLTHKKYGFVAVKKAAK